MEEILHYLGCIKPRRWWDKPPINWCRTFSINSSSDYDNDEEEEDDDDDDHHHDDHDDEEDDDGGDIDDGFADVERNQRFLLITSVQWKMGPPI